MYAKRTTNFSEEESNLLVDIVKNYYHILATKRLDMATRKTKHATWQNIADDFNAEKLGILREPAALRLKFVNLKKLTKKKVASGATDIAHIDEVIKEMLKMDGEGRLSVNMMDANSSDASNSTDIGIESVIIKVEENAFEEDQPSASSTNINVHPGILINKSAQKDIPPTHLKHLGNINIHPVKITEAPERRFQRKLEMKRKLLDATNKFLDVKLEALKRQSELNMQLSELKLKYARQKLKYATIELKLLKELNRKIDSRRNKTLGTESKPSDTKKPPSFTTEDSHHNAPERNYNFSDGQQAVVIKQECSDHSDENSKTLGSIITEEDEKMDISLQILGKIKEEQDVATDAQEQQDSVPVHHFECIKLEGVVVKKEEEPYDDFNDV